MKENPHCFYSIMPCVFISVHSSRKKQSKSVSRQILSGTVFAIPEDVKIDPRKACNDCHSNNTNYPWYSNIQPVDWWLNNHIKEGKSHLNFDEYTNRSLRFQYHKMEETVEMVKENDMPLNHIHGCIKTQNLLKQKKANLIDWADGIMDYDGSKIPDR